MHVLEVFDCRVIYSVDNDGKIDGESKYNIRSTVLYIHAQLAYQVR
jgi:hypothetical protein